MQGSGLIRGFIGFRMQGIGFWVCKEIKTPKWP